MKKRFALLPVLALAMSTAFVACDDGATEPPKDNAAEISSSSVATSSDSNDGVLRVPAGGVFSWTAADDGERVITGLDNGTETSGYWYEYSDVDDGGGSYAVLSEVCPNGLVQCPNSTYDNPYCDLDKAVKICQGLVFNFSLAKGTLTNKPFVGIGFNVAGEDKKMRMPVAGDASAWGGLCVAYTSTHDISLELGFGEAKDQEIGYDNPSAKLPKSEEGVVKCIPWSNFNKAGLDSDITEATKKLVAVKFKFVGEDKDKGECNIMSVGSYVEQ